MRHLQGTKEYRDLTKEVGRAYKQGSSIREIASEFEVSYGKAHRFVVASGVKIRPRGGAPTTKKR